MFALIVKYTLLEAYKKKFFVLIALLLIACIGIAYYAKSISITESDSTFIYFYNATIRIVSVFILAWYCILWQNQLVEKARLQLQLALPIRRTQYCLYYFCSYLVLATMIALLASLPLVLYSKIYLLEWFITFLLELYIVIALAYGLSYIFNQAIVSISCFTLIYIFARNAEEFNRHAENVLPMSSSLYETISLWLIILTSYLVPNLEAYANSSLLEDGISITAILYLAIQSVVYMGILFFIANNELRKRHV